jgi:hypothetical protein
MNAKNQLEDELRAVSENCIHRRREVRPKKKWIEVCAASHVAAHDEMQWFLLRLADTLRDCNSNSSRLRLIEHAERMMIEEQHEWFSTTRNFSV